MFNLVYCYFFSGLGAGAGVAGAGGRVTIVAGAFIPFIVPLMRDLIPLIVSVSLYMVSVYPSKRTVPVALPALIAEM